MDGQRQREEFRCATVTADVCVHQSESFPQFFDLFLLIQRLLRHHLAFASVMQGIGFWSEGGKVQKCESLDTTTHELVWFYMI